MPVVFIGLDELVVLTTIFVYAERRNAIGQVCLGQLPAGSSTAPVPMDGMQVTPLLSVRIAAAMALLVKFTNSVGNGVDLTLDPVRRVELAFRTAVVGDQTILRHADGGWRVGEKAYLELTIQAAGDSGLVALFERPVGKKLENRTHDAKALRAYAGRIFGDGDSGVASEDEDYRVLVDERTNGMYEQLTVRGA